MLRQTDQHLTLAIGGQGKHGLTGGHHLPHFYLTLGDHAVLWRAQHGITGLIAGHVLLGLELLELGFTGAVEVFGIVELRTADHLAVEQGFVAIALGTYQIQIGLTRRNLRAGGIQLQPYVLRVEFCQRLIRLDPLTFIHQALGHFAADAERQLRVKPCPYLTRITLHRQRRRLRLNHQRRADSDFDGLLLSARRQQKHQTDRQSAGQGMAQHGDDLSLMRLGIFILDGMLLILNSPVQ